MYYLKMYSLKKIICNFLGVLKFPPEQQMWSKLVKRLNLSSATMEMKLVYFAYTHAGIFVVTDLFKIILYIYIYIMLKRIA